MALSTFADGRLWGERWGGRPPVVLALHGWRRDHTDFAPVLAGTDAIALDLPGFGVAPEPPEPWSSADYARFIQPVLAEMSPGPVVVVGHSFGGRVAVHLAAESTERVRALVLTGAPLALPPGTRPLKPALGYRVARAFRRAGLLSEHRMAALRRRHGSADYQQASDRMRAVLVKSVVETRAGSYLGPLREWARRGGALELVWGAEDKDASLAGLLEALSAMPALEPTVRVVPGAGHLLVGDLAKEVREAVLRCAAASAAPTVAER